MKNISDELSDLINNTYNRYKNLNETMTSIQLAPDKWTLEEIIGHLIDSASNNHQRFVRLQITSELIFPDYTKDNTKWIEIQNYNEMQFADLLLLWLQYNKLICHIIQHVDPVASNHIWKIEDTQFSLQEIMVDYLRHTKDHISHFEERLKEIKNTEP